MNISDNKYPKPKWRCEVPIYSYSHVIKKDVFNDWNNNVELVKFHRITDKKIRMILLMPPLKNEDELYTKFIMMSYINLVALNISTFGHFWWPPPLWPVKFINIGNLEIMKKVNFKIQMKKDREWGDIELKQEDLRKVMTLVVGGVSLDERYFEFYGLAMTLLSMENIEHQFYNEIFANFYKIIERLTVVDVLKEKKLKKEKKQIKKAMQLLGMEKDIIEKFDEIYKIRSRDTMHSWGNEKPVTFEEAGKCKVLCEYMLYKYLKAEVDKRINKKNL